MKFFSLIKKNLELYNKANKKIIPSEEIEKVITANELLEIIKKEKEEIIKEAEIEAVKTNKKAYFDGYNDGLQQFLNKIPDFEEKLKVIKEDVSNQLLKIALKAAKKIVGKELELHPDRIIDIITQSLKSVMQHHKIKIYVNKDDLNILEKNKQQLKDLLEQVESFTITDRMDIEKGGCVIETEAGIINAQIENLWKAIEKAFKKMLN